MKGNTMSRIPLIDAAHASTERQQLLGEIRAAFGTVPNMFRAVANSPAALRSMWSAFGALGQGSIPAPLSEKIAVAVDNRNDCHYCLAAHTALGKKAGASEAEMAAAQVGQSTDPATAAALAFALKVVEQRGKVGEADVAALRGIGYSDEQIVEIVAHVALNLFTNYINVAFDVPVDFPAVGLRKAA
jgi:uncharacterized peroxidase-related enzyme